MLIQCKLEKLSPYVHLERDSSLQKKGLKVKEIIEAVLHVN